MVNRAQINRGTFYAHYSDISDVIRQMMKEAFQSILDVFADQNCTIEALPGLLLGKIETVLDENQQFYRRILASNASKQLSDRLYEVVVENLLEHEGDFETISHGDFEMKVRFCAGGLSRLYQDWFSGNLQCSREEFNRKAELLLSRVIGL